MSEKEPEVKTNTRFPKSVHEGLGALAAMTGVSQNDIIVEAVRAVIEMARSDKNWIVPKIVIQARAVSGYLAKPPLLIVPHPGSSAADVAPAERYQSLRVAEEEKKPLRRHS